MAWWHLWHRGELNPNSNISVPENALENVVCDMAAILSRERWVTRISRDNVAKAAISQTTFSSAFSRMKIFTFVSFQTNDVRTNIASAGACQLDCYADPCCDLYHYSSSDQTCKFIHRSSNNRLVYSMNYDAFSGTTFVYNAVGTDILT